MNRPQKPGKHLAGQMNPRDFQSATLAYIAAANARIEGMKALNAKRVSEGYALTYDEDAFFAEAQQLDNLGQQAINLPS